MLPTPFYEDEFVAIFNADNRDIIPHLEMVDITMTDPPFGRDTHEGARSHAKETKPDERTGKRGLVGQAEVLVDFDHIELPDLLAFYTSVGKITRRWCVAFNEWHYMSAIDEWSKQDNAPMRFIRFGMWDKPNGAPQFTGDRPSQGWEAIAILHQKDWRGMMKWNGGGKRAVWTANIETNPKKKFHKTQKSHSLMCQLVTDFTYPFETILDAFGGVGSTAVAAKQLRRKCILIEQNTEYCRIAAKRVRETQPMLEAIICVPAEPMMMAV